MPENQTCQYCGKPTDGCCYDCEATTIRGKNRGPKQKGHNPMIPTQTPSLREMQTRDLMKLTGCDRQTCIQALNNHESAYDALKYLKSLPTNENPAKLLNNPYLPRNYQTIKQSPKRTRRHAKNTTLKL